MAYHIHHSCGYEKDIPVKCEQCGQLFCEDDTQQCVGGLLMAHRNNRVTIIELQESLTIYKNKINEIITWSNSLPNPFKSNIIPL